MTKIKKIKALLVSALLAVIAVFCGCFTACNSDNGDEVGGIIAPEPLTLIMSVEVGDDGENIYTINAIVNPSSLVPRWTIVWEDSTSEWAMDKEIDDYINFELSNGDRTVTISKKQPFGETALLTATISSPTGEVSASKRIENNRISLIYTLSPDESYYIVSDVKQVSGEITAVPTPVVYVPSYYKGLPVKEIGEEAFKSVLIRDEYRIEISDNVEVIGRRAFVNCSAYSITFSSSVTSIGVGAFSSCRYLKSIVIPNSITQVPDSLCKGCDSLETVILPDTITGIRSSAFSDCKALESIVIPAGVKFIGAYAFAQCSSLKNVTFLGNKSAVSLELGCFQDCPYQP